ncbi:uncharacterized protein N7511_010640 [Penicillium nucicola]|uniref:uncharacterized protein n=1 Tax=Penicillium nucicola TaxID=1850975 RepID=UPI0025450E97|nr:uncharacterized protein N7511_010640 [Penicillium nucicola]KAJ5748944.1 hypothetical protein N7511_010640 [Penicillium nucicola]
MGKFIFKWPNNASEVFVTGTFDDWGKTVKLDRVGDIFVKEVSLAPEKTLYKFVVDGIWTTDSSAREEDDGHSNINNVLLPEEIVDSSDVPMSGVTPDSTTAALAANVPKHVNGNLPGTFPDTPNQESEKTLGVDPIPASGGYGNPVKLAPGEKVPPSSELHNNTVDSTVKLDQESYEKGQTLPVGGNPTSAAVKDDAFAFTIPPVTSNMIPESSLPIGGPAQQAAANDKEPIYSGGPAQQAAAADPGYTIQSAAPTSTTAALAAKVPLESKGKQTNGNKPVEDVPEVVKDSLAEAHQDPEAAANQDAVDEKKRFEQELHKKVDVEESAGAPAPTVTAATQPIAPHLTAAASGFDSADVSPTSTPPPGRNAATAAPTSAPKAESSGPVVTTGVDSAPIDETTTAKSTGPTVTTGPETTKAPETSTPKPAESKPTESKPTESKPTESKPTESKPAEPNPAVSKLAESKHSQSTEGASTNGDKKKKRLSGFIHKLKEKFK